MRRTVVAPLFLALGYFMAVGCVAPEDEEVVLRSYDYDRFVAEVQPILAARCANPTCHGRPERALSIYSPLAWRADSARTYLIEELGEDELEHNYDVSRALASESAAPEYCLLLRKPLGDAASTYHGGGDVFEGETDPDYRTMLDWLSDPRSP